MFHVVTVESEMSTELLPTRDCPAIPLLAYVL